MNKIIEAIIETRNDHRDSVRLDALAHILQDATILCTHDNPQQFTDKRMAEGADREHMRLANELAFFLVTEPAKQEQLLREVRQSKVFK